jgi:hypothetical protein
MGISGSGQVAWFVQVPTSSTTWTALLSGFTLITDSSWTRVQVDVTAYKSATFQVMFTHEIKNNANPPAMSGWNVDDVTLSSDICN